MRMRMRRGSEGARGTDVQAGSQEQASQPGCPDKLITDGETASSVALTGAVQYRSEPTIPDATGKISDRLSIGTCHHSNRPASSVQGWHAGGCL